MITFLLLHKPNGEHTTTEEQCTYLPCLGDLYTPANGDQVRIVQRSFDGNRMPLLQGMKALQEGDDAT